MAFPALYGIEISEARFLLQELLIVSYASIPKIGRDTIAFYVLKCGSSTSLYQYYFIIPGSLNTISTAMNYSFHGKGSIS